jgi:hypothetical protein
MSSELVVVVVEESISEALAGRAGCAYVSPAQPREQAMALVALLLGSPNPSHGDTWTRAIAGGRRVIALHPAD